MFAKSYMLFYTLVRDLIRQILFGGVKDFS